MALRPRNHQEVVGGGYIGGVGLGDWHRLEARGGPQVSLRGIPCPQDACGTGQHPRSSPGLPSDPCAPTGPAAPGAPGGRGLAARPGCRSAALREAVLPRRRDTAQRIYIAAHRLALRQWCWESRVLCAVTRSRAAAEAQRTAQVAP